MFGFETVEIVGGLIGLVLLGLLVWKLTGSEEANSTSESSKSKGKGKNTRGKRGK